MSAEPGPSSPQIHPAETRGHAVRYLLAFQSFNAMSFTIILNAPMVLTARHLGASEAAIGILNSLTTLLVVLQLFGTVLVERYGARRVMVNGWTTRTMTILPIAAAPFFAGVIPPGWLVFLGMGVPLFLFSFVRGFATTSWLPWLNEVLLPRRRGAYFGMDQMAIGASQFFTLLACGWFLGQDPPAWRYSTLFVFSFLCGITCVQFLRRVPGGHPAVPPPPPAPMRERLSKARRLLSIKPYRATLSDRLRQARRLLRYRPYRRTLRFIVLQVLAISAMPTFLVLYLRDQMKLPEGAVLRLQSAMTLGVFLCAIAWGRLSDRAGSRPMLRISSACIIAGGAFWLFAACGIFHPPLQVAFVVLLFYGAFQSMHGVAQARLMLGCCPQRLITIGTAVLQVSVALSATVASIAWGLIINVLGGANPGGPAIAYAIFFFGCVTLAVAAQTLLTRVPEPRALRTSAVLQVLYAWPARLLAGLVAGDRQDD